ncbi:hypothetical protein TL16_g03052 [Triparma laevis f. inornata]|uniref:DNA polymerase epsilon subunit n=2 Tax=Triparma laevis TaxID=1534972 RepID=A0A9W7L122_9STRA|nr:hypothetical protein TL16_g03052 [Triparma laevis f. inornata]GMI18515.1 hypothetical protein TrLO_g14869 [Triparma laevis f. longispina]
MDVQMSDPALNIADLSKYFKRRGLTLSGNAASALENVLARESDPLSHLPQILSLLRPTLTSSTITLPLLTPIIASLTSSLTDVTSSSTSLITPFDLPQKKILYYPERKSYEVVTVNKLNLTPEDISQKPCSFLERYHNLLGRIEFNDYFRPSAVSPGIKIVKACSAVGRNDGKQTVFMFGMLTLPNLEDDTGFVKIDLSNLRSSQGYIFEGCFVVVEGVLENGGLTAIEIHHPPFTSREGVIKNLGKDVVNSYDDEYFGYLQNASTIKRSHDEGCVITLQGVEMDLEGTVEKLRKVFGGFEGIVKWGVDEDTKAFAEFENEGGVEENFVRYQSPVFVLMGSFTSTSITHTPSGIRLYKHYMDLLANTIAQYPYLAEHAKFIIVPGENDPVNVGVLPWRGISKVFVKGLTEHSTVKNVHLASNPCTVKLFHRSIIIFNKPNILTTFRREKILDVEGGDGFKHVFKCILDQGHLCPLPPSKMPHMFNLSHSLRLDIPPTAVVLGAGEEGDSFKYGNEGEEEGVDCVVTGGFGRGEFVVYYPGRGEAEISGV